MTDVLAYKLVLDLLGAAGDAMVKLTDGFKHMITTGYAGYNHVAAKRAHKRLVDLSARATNLLAAHQSLAVRSIDEYISKPEPTSDDWYAIIECITYVIEEIKKILDDVQEERSDFVLEDAYSKLSESLASRASLLQQLFGMPAPKSEREKRLLSKINAEYKRLLENFKDAIIQLNLYLKQQD